MSRLRQLLDELDRTAEDDWAGAWERRDEAMRLVTSGSDAVDIAGFLVYVGGCLGGRWDQALAELDVLISHPCVESQAEDLRSLWRARAALLLGAHDSEAANRAAGKGVHNRSEACRLESLAAQVVAAAGRFSDAIHHLTRATELVNGLPADDPAIDGLDEISGWVLRESAGHYQRTVSLTRSAAEALVAAAAASGDWRRHHDALVQRGHALLLTGQTRQALALIQDLIGMEDREDAGPAERFRSTALAACLHSLMNHGTAAANALEACEDFARRAEGQGDDLHRELDALRSWLEDR